MRVLLNPPEAIAAPARERSRRPEIAVLRAAVAERGRIVPRPRS
jgi:hypothetical protein